MREADVGSRSAATIKLKFRKRCGRSDAIEASPRLSVRLLSAMLPARASAPRAASAASPSARKLIVQPSSRRARPPPSHGQRRPPNALSRKVDFPSR
jgi:hypothetical protein